jgi:toxin-antitoxin system PIN domain toxin
MIPIDANLLLYAYDPSKSEHPRARAWLESTFSSEPQIGLPLVSVLAFVRIATDRRIIETPLNAERACDIVHTWLARDNVWMLEPGSRHWSIFGETLRDAGASGPRVTDVHLAALAIEHGATFFTNDRDFRIFPKLAVRFPILERRDR